MIRRPDQRGFTLQEVMISIFISSLLGLLVISVFLTGNRFFNITQADVDIQTEMARIINLFQQDVRGGESISEYPLGSPTFTTDGDTLVVRSLSIKSDGDVLPTTYDYFIYSLSGSGPYTLTRTVVANGDGRRSSSDILSTKINSLSLTYNATPVTNASEVIIEVNLTKQYEQLQRTLTGRAAATLRN